MQQRETRTTAREKLLRSAQNLMLERGYNGTTVDEICAHAKVSKGSFYHFFNSKEELGIAALEHYYNEGTRRFLSGPFEQAADPQKRLIGFLRQTEARSEEFWGHGCLLGSFAIDLGATHPMIRQRVARQFDALAERLAHLFRVVAGPKGRNPSAKELAASYLAALEGGIIMARAFDEPGRIRRNLLAFRRQLQLPDG